MEAWSLRIGAILQLCDPTVGPKPLLDAVWQEAAAWEALGGIWLECRRGHLQPAGTYIVGAAPDDAREIAELASPTNTSVNTDGLPVVARQIRDGNVPVAVVLISHRPGHRDAAAFLAEALARWSVDRRRLQLEASELAEENQALRDSLTPRVLEHDIITISGTMENLIRSSVRAAASNATVLIQGETGTGKELLARLVHTHSPRSNRPMVSINAGALTPSLLEGELFGHRRGAFTGAEEDRKGLFEVADGGTLFLDEIGELTPEAQVRLLRVLQERTVTRLGDHQAIPIDVRVIAATHRDLELEVAQGRFRQDLYYRLNVVSLNVPSLRDRAEDVPVLVNHFLQRFNAENFKQVSVIPRRVLEMLSAYPWPGNVRELENVIQKAVVMAPGEVLPEELIPPGVRAYAVATNADDGDDGTAAGAEAGSRRMETTAPTDPHEYLSRALEHYADAEGPDINALSRECERLLIVYALNREHGIKLRAARALGINRVTLDRKLAEYGIRVKRGTGVIEDPGSEPHPGPGHHSLAS